MKKLLKNIITAGIIGFIVGMAIASMAPAIATIAGVQAGGMANPVFMGLFASSWGMLGAVATPIVTTIGSKLFGKKTETSHDIAASVPAQTIEEPAAETPCQKVAHYRQRLAAERGTAREHSLH